MLGRNITAALCLLNILIKREPSLLSEKDLSLSLSANPTSSLFEKCAKKTYSLDKPYMEEKSALKFVHLFKGYPQRGGNLMKLSVVWRYTTKILQRGL